MNINPAMTNLSDRILLIPDKDDIERDAVAEAWVRNGGTILRIGRFWDPPALGGKDLRVYGNTLFCIILAEKLGLQLISPLDELLIKLDAKWTGRSMEITTLVEAKERPFPVFIKPVVPKLFKAAVYDNKEALEKESADLDFATPVYLSELVDFTAEVRCFVLDGKIMTLSLYEGSGSLEEAGTFIQCFLNSNQSMIPRSFVLDAGFIQGRGWAVIEANPTWGAGLNGCDPSKAIWSIAQASEPLYLNI